MRLNRDPTNYAIYQTEFNYSDSVYTGYFSEKLMDR